MSAIRSSRWPWISAGILALMLPTPAVGDPIPNPGPGVSPVRTLPPVFPWRVTDSASPSASEVVVEFEVLNWSNQAAHGLRLDRTATGTTTVVGGAPVFDPTGVAVDANGRPLGAGSTPPPGNLAISFNNDWSVSGVPTANLVVWEDNAAHPGGTNSPLPNVDLLGLVNTGTPAAGNLAACNAVPGCVIVGGLPVIANVETIDNGGNVLDGFVISVDDWEVGEQLSFNWDLLDGTFQPIGNPNLPPSQPGAYGFGFINMIRLNDGAVLPPVNQSPQASPGSFNQSATSFFSTTWDLPDGTMIAINFAAGTAIPEPGTLGLLLMGLLGIVEVARRRRSAESAGRTHVRHA